MIPGMNILNMALTVIAPQSFQYKAYASRTTGPNGMLITSYADPVSAHGSVQPVPRNLYQQMGLNFQKSYYWFFISQTVVDISRDVSGDQFLWNGQTFQAESKTDWKSIDGWTAVLTVMVPNAG